jgi:hypothetical protein
MCTCIPWFTYHQFGFFCTFLGRESTLVTETRFKGRACWCPTCRVTRRVLDWIIGFIAPYTFTQPGTTGNTAQSVVCTLSSSPLRTRILSSLVVSWQRIYYGLTVTSHMKYLFHSLIPVLPFSAPANSEDSTLFSVLLNWILLYKHVARSPRKTPSSIVPYCFRRDYRTIA